MAAVDFLQRLVVCRLQAEFDEDIDTVSFLDFRHIIEIYLVDAVRPRSYGDTDDIGLTGLDQVIPEYLRRQVGIGKILKIGYELLCFIFRLDVGNILLYLFLNRHRSRQIFITGTDGSAVNTAPHSQCTIPVRTGVGNADWQFIYLFSICCF